MSSPMKPIKQRNGLISHAQSGATDKTTERKAGRLEGNSNLRTTIEVKKLLKSGFSVNKKDVPFETFTFTDELSVREYLADQSNEEEKDRSALRSFNCQDSFNFEFECFVIPSKKIRKKGFSAAVQNSLNTKTFQSLLLDEDIKNNTAKTNNKKRGGRSTSFFTRRRNSRSDTPATKSRNLGSGRSFGFSNWKRRERSSIKTNVESQEVSTTTVAKPNITKLFEEFGVLACSKHENLQYIKSTLVFDNTFFVFCESFESALNLYELVKNHSRFASWRLLENHVAYVMKSVVSAVAYLHSENRVVRNLSLKNVCVKDGNKVKLKSLFHAKELTSEKPLLNRAISQASYMAPEMISSKFGVSVDVWSIGVITRELLLGQLQSSKEKKISFVMHSSRCELEALIQISRGVVGQDIFGEEHDFHSNTLDFCDACMKNNVETVTSGQVAYRQATLGQSCGVNIEELSFKKKKNPTRVNRRATAFELLTHSFLGVACSPRTFAKRVEEINELSIF